MTGGVVFLKLFSTVLNYAPITLCLRVNNTHDIVRNMKLKLVLDTNVLVTAFCNQNGASHLLMRHALSDKIVLLASPALWLEYEAVLKRPSGCVTAFHLKTLTLCWIPWLLMCHPLT